jgi:hypothetical protein
MSVTGFQRRRRAVQTQAQTKADKMDLGKCSNDKLKALLDERGIEYDARANKATLIKLLEGAE